MAILHISPERGGIRDTLEISVDVLGEPERISSGEELDVKRYGAIVEKGYRRGLLLPDLEGVDTVDEQISIAKKKAGIDEDEENVKMYRFEDEDDLTGMLEFSHAMQRRGVTAAN